MRASYGFQASIALLGIALYIFSVGYVGVHAIQFFKAQREYSRMVELHQELPGLRVGSSTVSAVGGFGSAKASLIRAAIIGSISFACGICCTVVARKLQGIPEDEPPRQPPPDP